MGLAARPMPGMAFVPMRFVLDMQALGRESLAQLFRDQILGSHGRKAYGMGSQSGSRFSDRSGANEGEGGAAGQSRDARFCSLSSLEGAIVAPA